MLPVIGVLMLVLIVGLTIYIATRPNTFRVERSALIGAPVETVFPLINDLQAWRQWSPWEKKDPDMQRSYSGPAAGPGAMYAWAGDKNVGEGRMTVMESKAAERVDFKLEFLKPFAATNQARFTLRREAGGTRVHWSMDGKSTLMTKIIGLFINMDKMIGNDFEQGLKDLDRVARAAAP